MEGSFCPTAGAATFGQCTRDGNGCFTVTSTTMACTSPMTCTSTGVVPTGTACGCPAVGTTLNTGCATVGGTSASASDNAVLSCELVGACRLWRILVNCADQSLTAGTDTVNNAPACVCKPAGSAPGAANSVYVDPDPPMATFMTNQETGALQPPACRKRHLSDALALTSATITRVVAIHESSSSAHFTGEPQPLAIPDGVTLTTADGPSFNAAHYTIDLGASGTARVSLGNDSNLSGYTLSATGAGAAVDILGCRSSVPPLTAVTATADHLAILGTGTQVGIAARGRCTLTSSLISVSGAGTGINVTHDDALTGTASFTGTSITANVTGTGLVLGNSNSSATISSSATVASGLTVTGAAGTGVSITAGTATLTATPVTLTGAGVATGVSLVGGSATLTTSPVSVAGGAGSTGVSLVGGSATLATSPVSVAGAGSTGVSLAGGTVSLTSSNLSLTGGAGSRGVAVNGGTATLATSSISLTSALNGTARGIAILASSAQATTSVSMTGGAITSASSSALGAVGVDALRGTVTLAGVAVTVGGNTTGINVQNGTQLTVNGASVLTTSCKVTTSDCDVTSAVGGVIGSNGTGVLVPAGQAQAQSLVTIGGTTQINGFTDGIDVQGAGSLNVSGAVQVTANVNNGIQLQGQTTSLTTQVVNVAGATISGNGNDGVFVSTNIPTQVLTSTISGNHANGVNVAQSQNTTVNGYQFLLSGSTVATNGNATPVNGRGVWISAASKVGARLEGNHITGNVLEGVEVNGDQDDASPTEMTFNANHISGNLTGAAAAVTAHPNIIAGGVMFGGLDDTGSDGPIKLGQFIGNRVFSNGSNEIGFTVEQDGDVAWDLSSDAAGVDMGTTCGATAQPNYVYCYGTTGQLGVATSPTSIDVKIKGMHWANMNPTGGVDFTAGIPEPAVISPEPGTGVFLSCGPQAGCADVP